MYERFYGFSERPFSLLPDPDFLFLGEHHRTALDLLELAIVNQSGFCVISGEIGAGKTTLIRELLNRLGDDVRVGLVSNTHRSFGELMQWIMAAYGLPCGSGDRLELHKRFIDFVIDNYAHRQTTLLIIDEAQNLSVSAMEELRMLSNVNSDKHLVLQVVLVGQGQLRDKLRQPVLEQFAQRIAIDFHLPGLNEEETCRYIRHRIRHAGAVPDLFSATACRAVYRYSNGIPRLINRICDLALVYGYAEESPQITPELVQAVIEDQRMGKVLEAARKQPGALQAQGLKAVARAGSADAFTQVAAVRGTAPVDQASMPVSRPTRRPEHSAHAGMRAPDLPAAPAGDVSADAAHDSKRIDEHAQQSIAASHPAGKDAPPPAPGGDEPAITSLPDEAAAQRVDVQVAARIPPPSDARTPDNGPSSAASDHPVPASALHTLVVHAEQQKPRRRRGARTGLWLLTGIAVIATATAASWATRDAWYPLIADAVDNMSGWQVESQTAATHQPSPVVTAPAAAAAPSVVEPDPAPGSANIVESQAAVQVETQPEAVPQEAMPQEAVQQETVQQEAEPAATTVAAAAGANDTATESAADVNRQEAEAAAAAQEAELRREQQRLARVKEEAERLKRERLAAERKLAEQRKARQALEEQARREREKLRQARSDEKLSAPAPAPQQTQTTVSSARAGAGAGTQIQGFFLAPAQEPAKAAVEARDERPSAAPQAPAATPEISARADDVTAAGDQSGAPAEADVEDTAQAGSKKFLANPCNGPTARFMSTCSRP
ncbi:MAG: AAA family ATPase [Thiogranum sp.]|nr:AAA family ATPase [Thiogranum sp.]